MAIRCRILYNRVYNPRRREVLDGDVSVISTISRSATPGWARNQRIRYCPPSGSIVVSGELFRLSWA